ncbi:15976_t:CDS:1 [Funneliformis mosseae]|uniref:15976_t:CDS:1 n=1 Tax=Funneliformis mosseae TaxID=27381 RepID=A0A9N9DM23_FUNMO|nr:15976_t:CDS:1 [Funneliformis mosseae]
MTQLLPPECLEKIFLKLRKPSHDTFSTSTNAYKVADLYSCTLVSRYWCKIATPLLYYYPFRNFRHLNNKKILPVKKDVQDYYKLLRTLLTCIPLSDITTIVFPIDAKKSFNEPIFYPPKAIFDYVGYIRELHLDAKLFMAYSTFAHKNIWMPSYMHANTTQEVFCCSIINYLVKYLCERCNRITILEINPYIQDNKKSIFDPIEMLTSGSMERKLSGLKKLYCTSPGNAGAELKLRDNPKLTQLYTTLSQSNVNLELIHNNKITSLEQAKALSLLISSQGKLKNIILSEEDVIVGFPRIGNDQVFGWYNVVFNSLYTHKERLEKLEFTYLSFEHIDEEALNSLCSLKNLKRLRIYKCRFLGTKIQSWAKSLTNLEVFEYKAVTYPQLYVAVDLLNAVFQSSSTKLKKLVLGYKRDYDQGYQSINQIPLYLGSLNHLELPKLFSFELISIFKSCKELIYFSTELDGELGPIGKLVPNSVQKIQLKDTSISVETLKEFLEGCVNQGGKLKSLEITGKYKLTETSFEVARGLGVRLIN